MIKVAALAVMFLAAFFEVVARAADGGGYPLAVITGDCVHRFEASDGFIVLRRWDETRQTFAEILRQHETGLVGSAIAIALADRSRIAILVTDRYQEYQVWEVGLLSTPLRARCVWRKKLDATLSSIHVSPSGYVLSGDHDVVHIVGTTECIRHVADRFAAAAVDGQKVLLADAGGLSSLSTASCSETAVRQLSLRGYGLDVARSIAGTVAIVRSGRRTMLMNLDEKFRPVGVIGVEGHRSWRLSRVGRFVVASAPESPHAFEIGDGSVRRLTLYPVVNGYVCPSNADAPILATDGRRLSEVRGARAIQWRTPYDIRGVYVDGFVLAMYAAGTFVGVAFLAIGIRHIFNRR